MDTENINLSSGLQSINRVEIQPILTKSQVQAATQTYVSADTSGDEFSEIKSASSINSDTESKIKSSTSQTTGEILYYFILRLAL